MKNKKYIVFLLIIVLVSGISLTSCDEFLDELGVASNPFIGTWRTGIENDGSRSTIVFTSSTYTVTNSASSDSFTGEYTYSGNTAQLIITGEIFGSAIVSGNSMTLNTYDGESIKFTKS